QARSNVFCCYAKDTRFQVFRVWMGGQRVIVCHKKVAVVILLHSSIVIYRTKVIAEVQKACRADAAHYYFFLHKMRNLSNFGCKIANKTLPSVSFSSLGRVKAVNASCFDFLGPAP